MTRGRTREGGNENEKGQQARYVAHPAPIAIADGDDDDEGRVTTTAATMTQKWMTRVNRDGVATMALNDDRMWVWCDNRR
jgi:hypothetical protein